MQSRRSDRPVKDETAQVAPDASATLFGVVADDGPTDPQGAAPAPQPDGPGAARQVAPPAAAASAPRMDPFDPTRLRLSQRNAASLGISKRLNAVPVRKPDKEWWVRAHPDECYRLETAVLELKADRETYLVDPDLRDELAAEPTFGPRLLILAVSRHGGPFIWPIRLPGPDGRIDSWSESALEAASLARTSWVRVTANMALGGYELMEAPGIRDEPSWPQESMTEVLKVAFRGKLIDSVDHPVLRRLRGEV